METLLKIIISFFVAMGIVWTLLPCMFGLHNYRKSHSRFMGNLAWLAWVILLLAHPFVLYLLWFMQTSYWWLLVPAFLHVLFLAIFGRDLSTN